MRIPSTIIGLAFLCSSLLPGIAAAQSAGFKDMKPGDFGYESALALQEQEIVKGFSDGTFRPDQLVTRAEALKIIAGPLMTPVEEQIMGETGFSDIAKDAWFVPYVTWAAKRKVIQGPPSATVFGGARAVTKAEFLKMLLLAYEIDPKMHGDIELPLAADVTNTKEWYYPFVRFAVSAGVTTVPTSGKISPGRQLSRIDVAVILHRLLQFRSGERTQVLLDLTYADLVAAQDSLSRDDIKRAEYASARALLTARGALTRAPDETAVKISVKISEAMRKLVRAYKAAKLNDRLTVIKEAQGAWDLADQAMDFSPEAKGIAQQIQTYASAFAKKARQ